MTMLRTQQIITVISGVLGVFLIVRGLMGSMWPLSVQFVAGVLLVVYAVFRWRSLG